MYIFLEKTASEQTCALLKFSAVENATKNHGSFMKNKINIIWAFASDQKEFPPLCALLILCLSKIIMYINHVSSKVFTEKKSSLLKHEK